MKYATPSDMRKVAKAAGEHAKRRADSKLDAILSGPEQDGFFELVERSTLKEAATWLRIHHEISLSATAISKWAARKRREADNFRFACLLKDLRHDNEQASQIAGEVGDAAQLNKANVALLSQALFSARRTGDPDELKTACKLFSMVMESVAKADAAGASVIAAETARDRFQFDAAAKALEHVETLQKIRAGGGSEREKIERAVLAVFGRRPAQAPALPSSGGFSGREGDAGAANGLLTSDVNRLVSSDVSSVSGDVRKDGGN